MKILLLGADGQVGFALHRSLAAVAQVIAATRKGELPGAIQCAVADLFNHAQIEELIAEHKPDWIVNAAAYTAVDKAEDHRADALAINADALAVIGAAAKKINARVLHFSTDYVFAGDATTPYSESTAVAPINAYGQSKLAGEQALIASGCVSIIIRTAWVYAARGNNFLRTMLRLAQSRSELNVVSDQRGTPTTANLLSQVATQLILLAGNQSEIYHLTAKGQTSWFEFAQEIIALGTQAGLLKTPCHVLPIAAVAYPTRAKRPSYSVLDCKKIESALGIVLPDWRDGLRLTISELAENSASPPR